MEKTCNNCDQYMPNNRYCIKHSIGTPPEAKCIEYKKNEKKLEVVTNESGGKQHKRPFRSQALFPKALLEVSKVRCIAHDEYGYPDDNYKDFPEDEHLGRALTHLWSAQSGGYGTGLSRRDDLSHAACRILMELEMEIEKTEN